MEITLLALLGVFIVLDWIAVARHIKFMEYVFKPGVILVLLGYLYLSTSFSNGTHWFALGLFFSLVGDIYLMLPRKQFMSGLVAFLMAHISYIVGFVIFKPGFGLVSMIFLVIISIVSYQVYILITSRKIYFVRTKLKIPIMLYTLAISSMLFLATLGLDSPNWSFAPAFMVSLGAFLFYVSDSIIAINKYTSRVQVGRLISMALYHIGQSLIIFGVVFQSHFSMTS